MVDRRTQLELFTNNTWEHLMIFCQLYWPRRAKGAVSIYKAIAIVISDCLLIFVVRLTCMVIVCYGLLTYFLSFL